MKTWTYRSVKLLQKRHKIPTSELARRVGVSACWLWKVLNKQGTSANVHERLTQIFDELAKPANLPPPTTQPSETNP